MLENMKQEEESTTELRFPAGMRVLVVDDDNTCLKLMYNLLRKCRYSVKTTNRAKDALRILKESPEKFDIMISDVEMPDMDGIKLLQLVGLEMNIPVIMLSSYSDTKRVMQGIRNGACDYLVKPVRIQELQNIWQHVVRRNKSITLKRPPPSAVEQVKREPNPTGRLKGKSPEENSSGGDDINDDDEQEDSGHENEDPTHQKKPRLFWSVELHQKFVDAVNSLGIEKAFPKKILDMMNVEGLTREKVASHLQKYRLYLRKVNNGSNEAANKMSAYEDGNIGPLCGGYGVLHSLPGATTRFPGVNQSFSHAALFGRLNTASGLSIRGLASSPMLQTAQPPNASSSPALGNLNATMFQNLPSLDQNGAAFANQISSNNGALDRIGTTGSNLQDPNRYPSNLGTTLHSSVHPQAFQNNLFTPNVSGNAIPPVSQMPIMQNDPLAFLCGFSSAVDLKGNLHPQDGSNGNGVSNFNYMGQSQMWPDNKQDCVLNSYNMSAASSSLIPPAAPAYHNLSQKNISIGASPLSQLEGASSQFMQEDVVQQPNAEANVKFDDFLLDDPKTIAGSSNGGSEYLEDIIGKFLKQDSGETGQPGDDFDLDPFSV
ncbi:hypothetical protein vseg_016475 [Gypsophila vaccaria]